MGFFRREEMSLFLIRYGEISVKGQNKSFFIQTLIRNIQGTIQQGGPVTFEKQGGRIYLKSNQPREELVKQLTRIPGIVSISAIKEVESDLPTLKEAGLKQVLEKGIQKPLCFRVTTRRTQKEFPHTSMEISREVGGYILRNTQHLTVDLHHPDLTLFIEVRKEGSFLYTEKIPGVGGLPVGTSGQALLLLSGGIDSPVAGWLTLKRGVQLEALYFHSPPFIGERSVEKVVDLCKTLNQYSPAMKLSIISLTPALKELKEKIPEKYIIIVMRRIMMQMAQSLAWKRNIPALITGESIGQVASQTLENINAISQVIDLPVLRPLSGMDKMEIIALAREIGTYKISIRPYEDCCTLFIPKHPILKANLDHLRKMEEKLPVEKLVKEAVEQVETRNLQ